jgi:hypothetical protein
LVAELEVEDWEVASRRRAYGEPDARLAYRIEDAGIPAAWPGRVRVQLFKRPGWQPSGRRALEWEVNRLHRVLTDRGRLSDAAAKGAA